MRIEKRAKRYRIPLPVRVRTGSVARNGRFPAEETIVENISQFGCYFLLRSEPTVGSEVEMDITIPVVLAGLNAGEARCRGRVVRVEKDTTSDRIGVACRIDHFWLVSQIDDSQTT
ncbi:MAG TPA: PilZ domain-containing protein [Terriglobia bacterium]|jgi:hypothetical protein